MSDENESRLRFFTSKHQNIHAMEAAAGNDLQQLEQHVKKLNER